MARTYTRVEGHENRPSSMFSLFGQGRWAGLADVVGMAVVGGIGGVLLGATEEFATATDLLAGEYYWSAVLTGNAIVLGFGWALLGLRHLGAQGWVKSALLAALLSFLAALLGAVVTKLGVELKFSFLVVAALPALAVGLWMARLFGAAGTQMRIYLAVGVAWILLGALMAVMLAGQPTPNKVPLPGSIPLWVGEIIWWLDVPLVLTAPLLATAFISGRPHTPGGDRAGWRSLLLPAMAFLILPLALAGCFGATVHLIPD